MLDTAELIPRRDAPALLRISLRTLDAWAKDGFRGRRLPRVRVGGHTYFRREDLESFITHEAPRLADAPRTPPEVKERLRRRGYKI